MVVEIVHVDFQRHLRGFWYNGSELRADAIVLGAHRPEGPYAFEEILVLGSEATANPPLPPSIVGNQGVLPSVGDVESHSVHGSPPELIPLELELPLQAALLQPGVAADDQVLVDLPLEEVRDRSYEPSPVATRPVGKRSEGAVFTNHVLFGPTEADALSSTRAGCS
jgi:hypothetical protein